MQYKLDLLMALYGRAALAGSDINHLWLISCSVDLVDF
jgi:hypothetical protein